MADEKAEAEEGMPLRFKALLESTRRYLFHTLNQDQMKELQDHRDALVEDINERAIQAGLYAARQGKVHREIAITADGVLFAMAALGMLQIALPVGTPGKGNQDLSEQVINSETIDVTRKEMDCTLVK